MGGHPLARPSGRITALQLTVKLIMSITFLLAARSDGLNWLLVAVYTAGTVDASPELQPCLNCVFGICII